VSISSSENLSKLNAASIFKKSYVRKSNIHCINASDLVLCFAIELKHTNRDQDVIARGKSLIAKQAIEKSDQILYMKCVMNYLRYAKVHVEWFLFSYTCKVERASK
jgi:hypothetical protein